VSIGLLLSLRRSWRYRDLFVGVLRTQERALDLTSDNLGPCVRLQIVCCSAATRRGVT
jgi:hypothetical protein